MRAIPDAIVEIDDLPGFHADTSVADGAADVAFFRRAVDVNVALIGVAIARFQAAKPKDPRYNRISPRRVGRQNFASRFAAFENGPRWLSGSDFLGDLHPSDRRPVAAGLAAETVLRRRDTVVCNRLAVMFEHGALFGDADVKNVGGVFTQTTCQKEREETATQNLNGLENVFHKSNRETRARQRSRSLTQRAT